MRDAWIRHLGVRWNAAPDRVVAMIRRHPEGRRLLDALNRALYAPAAPEPPGGQDIIEVTRSMLESAGERPAQPLPELYAH